MIEKKKENIKETGFAIPKENFRLLLIGFAIITLGFLLMMGGRSEDPNVFNMDMFSARRIIVAPFVVVFGFAFEIWAIMKKPADHQQNTK